MNSQLMNWLTQALFSQAAYSALTQNGSKETLSEQLRTADSGPGANMKLAQADSFATKFEIVKQYNHDSNGLSVAVFKFRGDLSPNGQRFLAIRGTAKHSGSE